MRGAGTINEKRLIKKKKTIEESSGGLHMCSISVWNEWLDQSTSQMLRVEGLEAGFSSGYWM